MTSMGKVIKYSAMAFAIFLAFSIISGIFSFAMMFTTNNSHNNKNRELVELENLSYNDYSNLDIKIKASELIIEEGNTFKVETNNKYIKGNHSNDTLYIEEDNHKWFKNRGSKVIITILSNKKLNNTNIDNGAGSMDIEVLKTNNLDLNLGAGSVIINNLEVLNSAKVETGAGEVEISSSNLNNLTLKLGVGEFNYEGSIMGNSSISQGVGEVNLDLIGSMDDYKIIVNKALGSVTIDDKEIKDDTSIGQGNRVIDIDGGIGAIDVNFTR